MGFEEGNHCVRPTAEFGILVLGTFRFFQPNGPAKVQCDFFWPDFWVEFWKVEFWEVNFSRVNFSGASFAGKNRVKKFDPRIRVRNSGVQNSFPRIRP